MIEPQIRSLFILLLISTSTLFFFNTHFTICLEISDMGPNSFATSESDAIISLCNGNASECSALEIEEVEIGIRRRRVLMMEEEEEEERRYISYATLKKDVVPCRRPGASYYNCRAVEDEANPYNRGCEIISGCARSISGDDQHP
ncbi:protein RALF-like 24 [Impatiens glandulifera]|uniref:protein RALF-like 24 n=1 Tax=Impatiens glandulifera TaxID=253017 RepID=UPI001FB11F68|nr:protein RALF-like 24 [Impatiens glandulifera]